MKVKGIQVLVFLPSPFHSVFITHQYNGWWGINGWRYERKRITSILSFPFPCWQEVPSRLLGHSFPIIYLFIISSLFLCFYLFLFFMNHFSLSSHVNEENEWTRNAKPSISSFPLSLCFSRRYLPRFASSRGRREERREIRKEKGKERQDGEGNRSLWSLMPRSEREIRAGERNSW